ncbi:hypothetical protein BGZ98_009936 [Dissophora globulifera]|nr:hypothetical protein BGZ98_009936 [Dissophora globulifera]
MQQLLYNVVNTGNRIESLITQTYELHENPVPRLFIILPKDERKRDIARNLVSKTFRLHFLCECGAHTGYEDGSPHKIHLASHDGYDIVQQSEFIKKYGPYLLVTLQMVRLSLIAAEAAMPALQHFKAVEGLDKIGEFLNITKKTIGGLLEESISFLESQSGNRRDRTNVHMGPADPDELSGPKGPQLRELESFLSLNDRSRVLGNLYRITTKSGHVKWVCKYHYKRLFQSSPIEELQAFTRGINGTFVEEEGMVTVRLDSEVRAGNFYRMMLKAKCVHELRVMLDWTVTRDHLQDLYDAVTDSNIVRLELSGCGKADGTSKIDGSLFRPLLDLMSNGKIQAMILERVYHRDFLYVDGSKMGAATRLRELVFNDLSTLDDGRIPTLPRILEFCPSLTTLSIKSEFAHDILSWIQRDPLRFLRLKTLVVHETGRCHYHLVVGLSKGQIEFIEVMRLSSGSWDADGIYELLSRGHITKLRVLLDGAGAHGEHCMEILRCNPNVDEFHLSIPELSASAVDWAILSMRESHARQQLIPQNQIKINCDTYPDVVSCTLNFNKDSQAVDVSTHIQLIPEKCNMDNLVALVGKYGWSVTRLDFQNHFSREFALALNKSVSKQGFSSLKRLLLDPARLLSLEDFACVDRIIQQSKHLTTLNAVFHMDDRNWETGASWLFAAYREILTGLTLEGAKGFIWNKDLAKLFPSRSELKNLEALSLKRVDTAKNVEPFVKWIAEMTSKPTPRRTLLKMFTRGRSTTVGSDSNERTHLKQIELDSITLDKGRWETIFKSLDCTALEKLTLMDNKLTSKQLEHLIKRIVSFADGEAVVPLRELNIGSHVDGGLWRLSDRVEKLLRKKAPQIELYKK